MFTAKEERIVRRAFDRAVEIANSTDYPELQDKLCAFFGSMSYSAGCPEVGIEVFRESPSANQLPKE